MKPLSHYMPKSSTQVQDDRTRMATRHGQRRFMMKPKGREFLRAGGSTCYPRGTDEGAPHATVVGDRMQRRASGRHQRSG